MWVYLERAPELWVVGDVCVSECAKRPILLLLQAVADHFSVLDYDLGMLDQVMQSYLKLEAPPLMIPKKYYKY